MEKQEEAVAALMLVLELLRAQVYQVKAMLVD
jgi:hypothetical protein